MREGQTSPRKDSRDDQARTAEITTHHPSSAGVAKFTAAVALAAIFVDAAVGHGLTWENDPYWTYWVTKTFLIATTFGLGTAWFGLGAGRGAVITAVHTIVLTVYYWTFSPVGLPSTPTWLDLEHTWITGLPIHFGVTRACGRPGADGRRAGLPQARWPSFALSAMGEDPIRPG